MKIDAIKLANECLILDAIQEYNQIDGLQRFADLVLEEAAKKAGRMVNGKSISAAIRSMKNECCLGEMKSETDTRQKEISETP